MNLLKSIRPIHIAIFALIVCIGGLIYNTQQAPTFDWLSGQLQDTEPPVPVAEPPVPAIKISPQVLEVANRNENGLYKGYGILVDYKGIKFVVTSRTLLMPADEVTVNGWAGSVFAVDFKSDLVALNVYAAPKWYDYTIYALASESKKGPLRIVTDGDRRYASTYVTIVNSDLREGWAALESAPAGSEGAPIFQDNQLVGLFLGFNQEGVPVVATSEALIKLGEQILEAK
jgi:hypothetical protein